MRRIAISSGTYLLAYKHEVLEHLVGDCVPTSGKSIVKCVDFRTRLQCFHEALKVGKVEIASSLGVSFLSNNEHEYVDTYQRY